MNIKEIDNFLKELRTRLKEHGVFFIERAQKDIMDLGITFNIATEIIQKLKIENYIKGPFEDNLYKGNFLWVFGSELITPPVEVFIKLSERKENQKVVCISFHKPKRELKYPFKK